MTGSAHLSWLLLSIGVALWSLPFEHGRIDRPEPVITLAGCGLAGLYCALVAGAFAG